ncbi:hypothetical protein EAE32_07535 [Kocuria tytonicola]|uniref:Uncharacterized protein n=1 Tax=Kocuria tytonicola TaxID=2055946 RepID=A0A3L9L8A7_9MICC|nr:hypothetical protein EAE32_07535 [Kocuria tytonicola]
MEPEDWTDAVATGTGEERGGFGRGEGRPACEEGARERPDAEESGWRRGGRAEGRAGATTVGRVGYQRIRGHADRTTPPPGPGSTRKHSGHPGIARSGVGPVAARTKEKTGARTKRSTGTPGWASGTRGSRGRGQARDGKKPDPVVSTVGEPIGGSVGTRSSIGRTPRQPR